MSRYSCVAKLIELNRTNHIGNNKGGIDFQSGDILQMALSLFGGHAKRVGTHANVGLPTVPAVVTSRKVLVDDCHAEPRRFLLS